MDKMIIIIYIDITNKILLYLKNKYKKYINMIHNILQKIK